MIHLFHMSVRIMVHMMGSKPTFESLLTQVSISRIFFRYSRYQPAGQCAKEPSWAAYLSWRNTGEKTVLPEPETEPQNKICIFF
jgi:hypothetical protein